MRLALVGNPDSGGGGAPAALAARLRGDGHDVVEIPIDRLPERLGGPADRLVVAGGDGSVGPVAALAQREDLPLAVVPCGTANDFARALGLPDDEDEALALAADPAARTRRIDLAEAGDTPWCNAAAAGLSVHAARDAAPLKSALGPVAYLVGAVRAALTARPVTVEVRADETPVFSGRAWQVIVAQTGAFGGGSEVGAADDADGALDVVVLPAGSRLGLARRAYGLRTGRIAEQEDVPHARGRTVTVDGATTFNVDGEVVELGPSARFTVSGTVAVVVP